MIFSHVCSEGSVCCVEEGATAASAAAAPVPAAHRRPTKSPRCSSLHFIILPCCNYRKLIYGNFYISRENNTTQSFDLNNTGINRHSSIYIIIVLKVGKTFGPPGIMTFLFKVNMSLLSETSLLTELFYSIIDLLREWPNLLEGKFSCKLHNYIYCYLM